MANVVKLVNVGLAVVADALVAYASAPHHIGWGVGTTPAAAGNTGLESASAESRVEGTDSSETTTETDDTYQVVGEIVCAGAAKAITEVGLFTAATDGILFVRATFSAINLEVGDSITWTIKTKFAQAT